MVIKQDLIASDASVCARCAGVGKTCCHAQQDELRYCFPLSEREEQRILSFDPSLVCPEEPNSLAFLDCMTHLFPDMRERLPSLFPAHVGHKRLPVTEEGYCCYLGPKGCILPRTIRPWYCLIFPFWVRKGKIIIQHSPVCLASKELSDFAAYLRAFGVTHEYVRHNYMQLLKDWGLETDSA